jgi:hypothetical protein
MILRVRANDFLTMDIVLKHRRLVYRGEVSVRIQPCLLITLCASAETYPLVKTFNKLVFPQAPSPLYNGQRSSIYSVSPDVGGGEARDAAPDNHLPATMATVVTYSKTNFLWVVLLSPNPQGILNGGPCWLGACSRCAVPKPLGLAGRIRQCAGQCDNVRVE